MDLTISLIVSNIMFITFILIIMFLDKEGIGVALKLRFMRGYVGIMILGKDKRLYLDAVKISSKDKDTELIEVRKFPYVFDYDKILLFKNKPFLIYKEGGAQPLEIKGKGDLGYGNLTPELLTNIIAIARASGQIPKEIDKRMEDLERIAIFVGALASVGAIICVMFFIKPEIEKILPVLSEIATSVASIVVPAV